MVIKYIPSGDKFKASKLWGEGRHQLSILKNAMKFQGLKQLQRITRFEDGSIIKCLSCFGQDVVEVFVPVFAGKEEEIQKRMPLSRLLPAFEVYDGESYSATYKGIVLCKGGGFNPPYEFVPKDSLPEDYYTEPKGELPEERIWWPDTDRRLKDIIPVGIADADFVNKQATAVSETGSGAYDGLVVKKTRRWHTGAPLTIDAWWYYARAGAVHSYNRVESLGVDYGFSYIPPGEPNPGNWPNYIYDNNSRYGGKKPSSMLNFNCDFSRTIQGSGNNNFLWHDYLVVDDFAAKFIIDGYNMGIPFGHWVPDPSVNFDSIDELARAVAVAEGVPPDPTFDFARRINFYMGTFFYSYNETSRQIWLNRGSVLDADHYALAFSGLNVQEHTSYSKSVAALEECLLLPYSDTPADCLVGAAIVETNKNTEGPLTVVIDGVTFELFPETLPEVSPRLQWCDLKYFRVGERSIGLFRLVKNYNYPLDFIYVYAEVNNSDDGVDSERQRLFVTPIENGDFTHAIPGVTDLDDNPLYCRGGFRLIYEEEELMANGTPYMEGVGTVKKDGTAFREGIDSFNL